MQSCYGGITYTAMSWLYIINICHIFTCVFAGIYFFCVLSKGRHKSAAVFSFTIIFFYQVLTLLFHYSVPEAHYIILNIRLIFAILLLPSIAYSVLVYLNKAFTDLSSLAFFIPYTVFVFVVFSYKGFFEAVFYSASTTSSVVVSVFTLVLSLLFFFYLCTAGRMKNRFITLNTIENTDETVIIYNKRERQCYVHTNPDYEKTPGFIKEIEEAVKESQYNGNHIRNMYPAQSESALTEYEIHLYQDKSRYFKCKVSPIIRNDKYLGKILVANDITQYNELIDQLNHKNVQLKKALDAQREHVQVMKKLTIEEERARIMELVNSIAGQYLQNLKGGVERLMLLVEKDDIYSERDFKEENDKMIRDTRKTIEQIRSTVKALNYKN